MRLAARVATFAALAIARPTAADNGFLHRLAAEVASRLDAAIAAHGPKLVPPVPVDIKWKPVRLGSLDLGAPLVALEAADLDGDGKIELYAVTSRHVIAIALGARGPRELGRVAFTGELAVPAPRDVVGTAIVDGGALVASVSTFAKSMHVHWRGKLLVGDLGDAGFELCPGMRAQLVPGRNYFDALGLAIYGKRCRSDLVDPAGYAMHVSAQLSVKDKLEVQVESCRLDAPCQAAAPQVIAGVGVAFAIADLDRDGRPEVVFAEAGAPGDEDAVRVVTISGGGDRPSTKKTFKAGVAGIALVDSGIGPVQVIAAVRFVGATRVDLWRLD
ncbi:MAG TPA: hypothetical protein VGO00_17745 [Kofleriaceae bacterium]|nr:hypothetical protein [Kofleriaceae bacterium]